jgi:hypothetical protein
MMNLKNIKIQRGGRSMNKKISLLIFISSLILSLNSIKAMLFAFEDEQNNEQAVYTFPNFSEIDQVLEEISIEDFSPQKTGNSQPIQISQTNLEKKATKNNKPKIKIQISPALLKIVFADSKLDIDQLAKAMDLNDLFLVLQSEEAAKKQPQVVCSPSEAGITDDLFSCLINLSIESPKNDKK